MVPDKTIWFEKIYIFPNLLTMLNVRWIKQKAMQTPSRGAEKTNDTDREEQDTGRVALLC